MKQSSFHWAISCFHTSKVRLKPHFRVLDSVFCRSFHTSKVRLKPTTDVETWEDWEFVSIPLRFDWNWNKNVTWQNVACGFHTSKVRLKRHSSVHDKSPRRRFHTSKVRLKLIYPKRTNRICHVSIPLRFDWNPPEPAVNSHRSSCFHTSKVRLKQALINDPRETIEGFHTSKVRLKLS